MIVNLANGINVNPMHVVSVTRDYYNRMVLVKDSLGTVYEISPVYGETTYDAEARVVKLLHGGESK